MIVGWTAHGVASWDTGAHSPDMRLIMAQRQIKVVRRDDGSIEWTMEGAAPLTLNPETLANEVRQRALMFGLIQTVSDAGALGKGTSVAAKRDAMAKRIETLAGGAWSAPRATGAPAFNVGDVVLALARTKTGGDVDRANRAIDAYAAKHEIGRDEAAKLFARDETVAVELARIRAARTPAKFDADEALLEMDTEPTPEPLDGADEPESEVEAEMADDR